MLRKCMLVRTSVCVAENSVCCLEQRTDKAQEMKEDLLKADSKHLGKCRVRRERTIVVIVVP